MASTYVNDLRLEEMATGDQSGTWGDTTNTNLELIAEAFSYGTEASFGSDADATTTIADGASDPARSLYLKITSGVSLTATRTLTIAPNTVSKVWIIENATSGSQSINISQGSGANVTIPNGDVKVIYTDGAGSGAAVVDAFTDLNLSGTTTVAALDAGSGAITTTGTVTGGTLAGTLSTAAQTNITSVGALDGGSITSGFGSIDVGSSAITTTGTVTGNTLAGTLSTAAQPNITSVGTLTGLDVAGTPTFDGLTVVGSGSNIRYDVSSSNPHTNPTLHLENQNATDGNVAALMLSADNANGVGGSAYIYAQSETTNQKGNLVFAREDGANTPVTSMKLSSNGDISFYEDTGTTAKLFWDASAESLGIGTTSPSVALEISDSTANAILRLTRNDTIITVGNQIGALEFAGADADDAGVSAKIIAEAESGAGQTALAMYTGTPSALSERLRIDKDGNVGIGTSSPSTNLEVSGTDPSIKVIHVGSPGHATMSLESGGSGGRLYNIISGDSAYSSGSGLHFEQSDGLQVTMKNTGNVGIGTDNPSTILHLAASSPVITLEDSEGGYGEISGSNGNVRLRADEGNTQASSFVSFEIDTAEEMRLNSTGLGIGTTNPAESLHTTGNIRFGDTAPAELYTNSSELRLGVDKNNDNDTSNITFYTNDDEKVRIDANGNVGIGTDSPQSKLDVEGGNNVFDIARFGSSTSDNSEITLGYFQSDATNGIPSLIGSSDFGGLVQGGENGHLVLGIRDNDATDAVDIISGGGNFMTDSTYDTLVATFRADGNVGIGTSSPSAKLEVNGGSDMGIRIVSDAGGYSSLQFGDSSDSVRGGITYYSTDDSLQFRGYNNEERMRIDASGNLLMGKTSTGQILTNGFEVDANNDGYISFCGDTAANYNLYLANKAGSGTRNLAGFYNASALVGSITHNGSNAAYNTSSDARLKDVTGSARGLEVINKLNPVAYNWKVDGKADEGLIAQEVKEIVPNAVTGSEEEMYQMDYSKLVVHLVKGMKEQQEQIEELKKEIETFKN